MKNKKLKKGIPLHGFDKKMLEGGFRIIQIDNLFIAMGGLQTNNCAAGNCVAGCGKGQNMVMGCGANVVPLCGA